MTVAELISELQKLPPELAVWIDDGSGHCAPVATQQPVDVVRYADGPVAIIAAD